jgi:hypothetical protein
MPHRYWIALAASSCAALAVGKADAEVTDASANGFTVRHQVEISADRAAVYDVTVDRVGAWWSSAHTVSGDAANLYIEPDVKGCFCERLGDEGGLVHLLVTFVNPGVMLRFTGGLGPLGLMGVTGNMTWEFEDAGDATVVTLQYAVGGYMDGGLDSVAGAVDAVLGEQLKRLKAYVESGDPAQG